MPSKIDRAAALMQQGCPIDLSQPLALYERLKSYLNGLGQLDGYWSPAGQAAIPLAYPDSLLARKLQESIAPGYIARTTAFVAERFDRFSWELTHMASSMGFEFANGWRIFPVVTDEEHGVTDWFVTGMLFPAYDGKTEGWLIFAEISEVFG